MLSRFADGGSAVAEVHARQAVEFSVSHSAVSYARHLLDPSASALRSPSDPCWRVANRRDYGFGTAERAQLNAKLFVSKDMVSDKFGTASPGPVYHPKSIDGRFATAPSSSFGTSHRYAMAAMKRSGAPVPGPGQYTIPGSVSKQHDSQKFSYSSWKFGTSTRADQTKVFVSPEHAKTVTEFIDSPGPCAYGHNGALGSQADSRKSSNECYVRATPA